MKTVISIVLILVGIVGIYIVSQTGSGPAPEVNPVVIQQQPEKREEMITVAVAKRDLANKTVLSTDDFEIKTMTIPERASEKAQFSLHTIGDNLINWALSSPVQEGSNIPVSLLVKPGTTEYISMFLQPGSVIYTFTIPSSDYYIFDNLKVGEYVDIYLAYDRNPASGDVVSPGSRPNITDVRLKPVMANKRVLSITPSLAANKRKQTNTNQNAIDGDDRIVVELSDHDVKVLKALDGKAKFVLFPSVPAEVLEERANARKALEDNPEAANANDDPNKVLSDKEVDNWPVTREELFASTTTVKRIEG